MYIIILWAAKIIQNITRITGHGGAALPGLFVEKVSKSFLGHYLSRIPRGVVVVSGTNGKTTTTKLMVESIESKGLRVFTNRSGSNMTRGLISAVISHASILGRMPYDIAILEIDEAYAAKFAENIPVSGAVVLNVMRDQLDRFGEIDTTAKYLSTLTGAAKDFVVLNAHDPRVKVMPSAKSTKKVFFGVSGKIKNKITVDDEWHVSSTGTSKSDKADYILKYSGDGECVVQSGSGDHVIRTKLVGVHNHLNVTACLAALINTGIFNSTNEIIEIIKTIKPAFGRGEIIYSEKSNISIQLVKNPSSFTQTVESCDLDRYDTVTVVINDAYADSRDVSWLWDVDFSSFKQAEHLIASGSRAYDLAVRLKHNMVKVGEIIESEGELARYLIDKKGDHVIFCTYTAMLNLRKHFVKKGHLERVL